MTDCQDDMLGGSGGIGSGMAGGLADGGAGSGRGGRGGGKVKNSDRKSARARTVLSEKQLNILKTCYSANPRPDALMKEQLVEMTGLSPRVVRVWFQNKRCKDKKLQIRASEKQLQRDAVSELHISISLSSWIDRFRNRSVDEGDLPYFTTLFTLCSPSPHPPPPDISVPRGRPSWANKKADSGIRSRRLQSVCTFFAERG